ncbi:hypothetical protein SAMN02745181_1695 [Rubritalea squalenifaciens DSM 18772]|uniref:Uncharacterized protein n=1 Tax=Rubritalea squalenifaciens DSM 18772 TaxID=1123071 RepID=A0A1M6I643_9BACT|nr:hypothetical protein [Rubritalea squalenifaciens]SHJ29898.1 hypothetical protein SAMN02745181_1695 [Rubritalea squalenifaciens DSM 18772]
MSALMQPLLHGQESADDKARVVPKEKSISFNRQLIVEGRNDRLRTAIADVVDDTAYDLYKALGVAPDHENALPINIDMYEAGNASRGLKVRPSIIPLAGGKYRIELLVDTRAGVEREVLQRGLIEVLIYELGVRSNKDQLAPEKQVVVPPWLVYGLFEYIQWKSGDSERRLYDILKERPELYSIDQAFRTNGRDVRQFDDTKEALFRASSCAFVSSLLRQKNGGQAMISFLKEVSLHEGEMENLLRKHFPGLNVGAKGLQKMWSLQVADMASARLQDVLSIGDTDRRLSEALFLTLTDGEGVSRQLPIDQFKELEGASRETRLNAVNVSRNEIMQLSYRCFPAYRPLLYGYIKVLEDVALGNMEDVQLRLVNLYEERRLMRLSSERVRDYLDWYQLTQARDIKGDFSGYMKLKDRLAQEREVKKDPVIDKYLDEVQALYQKMEQSEREE